MPTFILHLRAYECAPCAPYMVRLPPPGVEEDGDSSEPPRVLIMGPENSGKTSVCKILTNYAVRAGQGWAPLLVNTDPGEVGAVASIDGIV